MQLIRSMASVLLVVAAAGAQAQELPRNLGDAVRGARDAVKKAAQAQGTPPPEPSSPKSPAAQDSPSAGTRNASAVASPITAAPPGPRPDPRYSISATGQEVTDSKSGLTWRRCAEGMRFEGGSCNGQPTSFPSLSRALAHEKTQAGWRLPTIEELATVVRVWPDHRESNTGGIDLLAFPNIPAKAYWSSTYYYKNRGDRDRTKIIYFENGMEGYRDNGEGGLLLLVRSAKSGTGAAADAVAPVVAVQVRSAADDIPVSRRFVVSSRGAEVIDVATGLVWARCPEGMTGSAGGCGGKAVGADFAAAQGRAQRMARTTGLPWRLPEADELRDLSDQLRIGQSDAARVFAALPAGHFWTSHRTDDQYVYAVDLLRGSKDTRYQTSSHHVLLVRHAK